MLCVVRLDARGFSTERSTSTSTTVKSSTSSLPVCVSVCFLSMHKGFEPQQGKEEFASPLPVGVKVGVHTPARLAWPSCDMSVQQRLVVAACVCVRHSLQSNNHQKGRQADKCILKTGSSCCSSTPSANPPWRKTKKQMHH